MTENERSPGTIGSRSSYSPTAHYALTLTSDQVGNVIWSSVSKWVGHGSKVLWEMRAPGEVSPRHIRAAWKAAGQHHIVVSDRASLGSFLRVGGNALVAQPVARQWLPDVLRPVECTYVDPLMPPQPIDSIPKRCLDYAPSPKLRMQVLSRDDFRCRICGRRAADYVDIELHVHHVVPHGMGGLTEAGNLITLCSTCHRGLDPHYEVRLLSMIPGDAVTSVGDLHSQSASYEEGVRLYRRLSAPTGQMVSPESATILGVPASVQGSSQGDQESSGLSASVDSDIGDLSEKGHILWFQVTHNTLRKFVQAS